MESEKMLLNLWPETGQTLGVSRRTAYFLANEKDFPVVKIGRRKLVSKKGLEDWVAKQANGAH